MPGTFGQFRSAMPLTIKRQQHAGKCNSKVQQPHRPALTQADRQRLLRDSAECEDIRVWLRWQRFPVDVGIHALTHVIAVRYDLADCSIDVLRVDLGA